MQTSLRSFTVILTLAGLLADSHAENKLKLTLCENLSPEFSETVNQSISRFPAELQNWLEDKGVEVVSGRFLTQMRPDLKGLTPRGYPQGSTWDMSEGLHDRGIVYLPEFKRFENRNGETIERIELTRLSQVLHHELGHAIDYYGGFSQSAVFVNTFEHEKTTLLAKRTNANNLASLSYFLTPGNGGRKETFAELFSAIYNPHPSAEAQLMKQNFPETNALVRELISNLRD